MSGESRTTILHMGLCSLQACVPKGMLNEDVATDVTSQCPTGLDHPWAVDTESARVVCAHDSGREHVILVC